MDGRAGEVLGGIGIEMLDGAVPLGEVLADIGAESRMALHLHLAVEDEVQVEVLDGEEIGTGIVTTTTGGCRRLEGIVIPRLPGVVHAEAVAGTVGIVGVAGEGRGTRDLVVHPAETPDTIEGAVGPDEHTIGGGIIWLFT